MSLPQTFKKSINRKLDNTAPLPEGVRLEYTSFGQGQPSYQAPNALLQSTNTSKMEDQQQQYGSSNLNSFSTTTATTKVIGYHQPSQLETAPQSPGIIAISSMSKEFKCSQSNISLGQQYLQQNDQETRKQMKGKPNFMKKRQNQTVNAADEVQINSSQMQAVFKSDNQTVLEKAINNSSNNNTNVQLKVKIKEIFYSNRFASLDPLILLTESDLDFPDIDYPKKIVNDVTAAGGIRLKQTKEQLQQFLENSQSMPPCIVGSLLINQLLSKKDQPNIIRYVEQMKQTRQFQLNLVFCVYQFCCCIKRTLFACEILAKNRSDYRTFFNDNLMSIQQSQCLYTDSKYIALSNQLLASLNNPNIQIEEETVETQIDFSNGIDLQKFSKSKEGQEQQLTVKIASQTTNLLDMIASDDKDDSLNNNSRNIFDNGGDDDIFKSKPNTNGNQKNLFKSLHKNKQKQINQPVGNSINVIDILNEEDIKQQNQQESQQQVQDIFDDLEIKEVKNSNGKEQQYGLFGKLKKNNLTQQSNQLQVFSDSKQILDLVDDQQQQQQHNHKLFKQQQVYNTNLIQQNPSPAQIHPNQCLSQQTQLQQSQYIQIVKQQPQQQQYYNYQGYTVVYPQLLPLSMAQTVGGLSYSKQIEVRNQQYSTISMDFTAQYLEQEQKQGQEGKEKDSKDKDDLLNHALIDKDNFQIEKESPVNSKKKKNINEQAFDFVTL